jgi:hypothetical protein
MSLQIARIRLEQMNLFCPVTGNRISDGESEVIPSPATLFIYLHETGDFEYIRADLREVYDKINDSNNEDDENAYDIFLSNGFEKSQSVLLLSLCYRGMACGPVSTIVDYCFDLNYSLEND